MRTGCTTARRGYFRAMLEPFLEHHPKLNEGAWVHGAATVIGEVELGRRVSVWPGAVLRGDMGRIVIGDDSNIQDHCVVHMTSGLSVTTVGERVTVGHRALLHGCEVGSDCLIGMGAILLDNCVIPEGSMVGAGSLVTGGKTFPSGHLILGAPARAVRELTADDREWIAYSWKHYLDTMRHYRDRSDTNT